MVKRGLGRGLGALLPPGEDEEKSRGVTSLAVDLISAGKHQPRREFDARKLEELAASIKSHGVIQPIIVKPVSGGRYEIIAGERRWRATKIAGLKEIPVIIKEPDGSATAEMALIENLQREDLNPLEEAEAYRSLMEEHNLTQEEISRRVGKSRPAIANALRLLQLPEEVQEMLRQGDISAGHAKVILGLKDEEEQQQLARVIVAKQLSVREAEKIVRQGRAPRNKKESREATDWQWRDIEDRLQQVFTTRVKIKRGGNNSRIEIYYFNDEDLERILAVLLRENVPREII